MSGRLFDPEHVIAELPAVVLDVLVHPGDFVNPGQHLILLESMKMEIPVLAESTGCVSDVFVTAGQSVTAGENLIRLHL